MSATTRAATAAASLLILGAIALSPMAAAADEASAGPSLAAAASDEAALDKFEGVPEGLYYKSTLTVSGADGEKSAMLYRASNPAPGTPVPGYLERIIEVADSLDFPATYLEDLRTLTRLR